MLTKSWKEKRGLAIASFGVSSVKASEEDEQMIKEAQRNAINRNPNMAAATLVGAQAQAMQDAAKNTGAGGAMFGFAGMNMANNAGGMNAQNLFAMGQQQGQAAPQAASADTWTCSCGTKNTGKFCANCGKPKPADEGEWTCSCGAKNTGKFCANCGKPKPADEGEWTCSCGTKNTGKFCANCGKPRQ